MPTSYSQPGPFGLFRGYDDQHMRVSDAERQAVADRLGEHYSDGRLDQAEFDDRLGRAMSAKTRGDLTGLFDDLPDTGLPTFACKLRTDIGFLGREAVERARAGGPRRPLASLVLTGPADPGTMLWGGELVLRDGVAVGQVTSGAWGEAVGGCVGLAYLRHPDGSVLTPDAVRSGAYQVNVGGRLYPAAVGLRPPFDPAGDRVKGRYPGFG